MTTHWRDRRVLRPTLPGPLSKEDPDWFEPHTASQLNKVVFRNFVFPSDSYLSCVQLFRLLSWSLCCFLVPLIGRCITVKSLLSQNTVRSTADPKNARERLLAPRASWLNQQFLVCYFLISPNSNLCFLAMTQSAPHTTRLKDFNCYDDGSPVARDTIVVKLSS